MAHHEDIFAISGTERSEVGTEYPSEDHEAGVHLHHDVLGPRHLREAGQVYGVAGDAGCNVALDDITGDWSPCQKEVVLGVLEVEDSALIVVPAGDGDVGHGVAVESAGEEILLCQTRDVGEAELSVLEREAGGVANVPVHLHSRGLAGLIDAGHHTVRPHLVVIRQSQGDVVLTNLGSDLKLKPVTLIPGH